MAKTENNEVLSHQDIQTDATSMGQTHTGQIIFHKHTKQTCRILLHLINTIAFQ